MPRVQNPTIQIPHERLLQLKEVAAALGGATMSATIGHLIGLAYKEGLVGSHIPGTLVERVSDGLAIQIEDGPRVTLTREAARALSGTIRTYATGGKDHIMMDYDYFVVRQGNGVKVTVPLSAGTTKTYSVDLALDLANLIDRAIA